METFIRDNAMSWWHQSGTAKMGLDSLSVVDSKLKVYGIKNLRIADASVMPRVVSGNTMAPCIIIGERAATACGPIWAHSDFNAPPSNSSSKCPGGNGMGLLPRSGYTL